ncbi:MAG: tetratricopeptide repeat protein [Myxococcota bacterium]
MACFFLTQSGCANWKAADLYQSGTRALDQDDPGRAISDLERAASLRPDSSRIQNHLGIAYERFGQSQLALDAFSRAVELDCDNVAAAENLSALRREMALSVASGRESPVAP